MPHFLNIISVNPLKFLVTELQPLPNAFSSIQITRVKQNPLHVQPLCIRFRDQSVAVCFFEKDGTFSQSTQLVPPRYPISHIPDEVHRIPVPHIHPEESLIEKVLELKNAGKEIERFNDDLPSRRRE